MLSCVLFLLLGGLSLIIGINAARKISTFPQYALSRGFFSTFALVTTVVASFIGGGTIIGTGEKTMTAGLFPAYGLMGFIIQLLLTGYLLSKKTYRLKNILTVGDLFQLHYGTWAKKVVGILWLIFSLGIIAAQISSMGRIISPMLSTSFFTAVLLGGGILIIYTFFGGIRAVVMTDVLQFIVMVLFIPLVVGYVILVQVGWEPFMAALSAAALPDLSSMSLEAVASAFVGFALGDALIPPVIQRLLMCKNIKQTQHMMIGGACFSFIFIFLAAFLGIAASQLTHDPSTPFVTQTLQMLPPAWQPIWAIALMAVVLSSADTYLNSSSISLTEDLLPTPENRKLRTAQVTTLLLGVTAIIISLYVPSVYDMLLFTYKFWGPLILVPLLGILFNKTISKTQLMVVFGLSGSIVMIWHFFDLETMTGYSDLVPGFLISFLSYFLAFTIKNNEHVVAR